MTIVHAMLGALFALPSCRDGNEPLPAPTGPCETGRTSFHWKDDSREELETKAPDDKRELMVHLFYPADPSATGERAAYMPDGEDMRGVFPNAHLEQVLAMRAFSLEGAPLPKGDARYPVVLFAPGGGMKGLTYHTLCEDLASHGWVVAAIDPPYNARRVRVPDGHVLGNLSPAERGWPAPQNAEEERRFYRERIVHWSHDVKFVVDQLVALDAGSGPFAKRLDLARGVGVAGHSRGGQAAGTSRLLDPRVRGGVNLDGTVGDLAILPLDPGDEKGGAQPFLWIQKSIVDRWPTDEEFKRRGKTRAEFEAEIQRIFGSWHRQLGTVTGGAIRLYLERPGIGHIDFSDEPFWDEMSDEARAGKVRTIAETRTWLRAFFDGCVRGEWAELKRLVGEADKSKPETTVHVFGRMWP